MARAICVNEGCPGREVEPDGSVTPETWTEAWSPPGHFGGWVNELECPACHEPGELDTD